MIPVRKLISQFADIVFPVTCVCCGCAAASENKYICDWCENERFEYAHPEQGDILPDIVQTQFSLWNFDKGGYLQQMLHDLKYNNLKEVGVELGYILGKKFIRSCSVNSISHIENKKPVIVPIPLHQSKQRKRGFNQARAIGMGIQRATNWEIIDMGTILRVKNTKTQTGLNLAQRSDNLKSAFKLVHENWIKEVIPVIADDVFTTGATTFELAKTLADHGSGKSVILTVAKA